jgi:hypothetical protein
MVAAMLKLVVVVVGGGAAAVLDDVLDVLLVDASDRSLLLRANQIRPCGSLRQLDRLSSTTYQDGRYHKA